MSLTYYTLITASFITFILSAVGIHLIEQGHIAGDVLQTAFGYSVLMTVGFIGWCSLTCSKVLIQR